METYISGLDMALWILLVLFQYENLKYLNYTIKKKLNCLAQVYLMGKKM